jgi:predicted nucleic acid-binding protein
VVLVDSNVWIDELRGLLKIRDFIRVDQIAVCPAILLEVLRGARGSDVYRRWRAVLMRGQMLDDPMPLERFEEAAQIYRVCQDEGITINAMGDLLIATCAIHHDIPLLTRDGGFRYIAEIVPLKLFPLS